MTQQINIYHFTITKIVCFYYMASTANVTSIFKFMMMVYAQHNFMELFNNVLVFSLFSCFKKIRQQLRILNILMAMSRKTSSNNFNDLCHIKF